jgi:1,4-alpha-glucan branching enzyme
VKEIVSKEARPKENPASPEVPPAGQLAPASEAFVSFTLHAHLPYVIHYGTWPHGLEWIFEAAAETYLPLLAMLGRLERDGIALHCNLDLSPILLEQLAHPVFKAEFPKYVQRKIGAAREDEAFFQQSGDGQLAETARFWQDFYTQALDGFTALDGDLIRGFRHFSDTGQISLITSAATHGFLPLLGTDESVQAQIRLAVESHIRHFGRAPRGVWLPECGYRPAGYWEYPIAGSDGSANAPGFDRAGIERFLAESNIGFFFVDTHLIDQAISSSGKNTAAALYRPHASGAPVARQTVVFARDPRTAQQVWSSENGYPGDFHYLDFHKKRFPGGHRYWKVTGADVAIEHKDRYSPHDAAKRARVHAAHFAGLVRESLFQESLAHESQQTGRANASPPILNALFDAELFGHWWFEGILWLEAVARELHNRAGGPRLIDCERYLEQYPLSRADSISMSEGSWGAGGSSQVWLNQQTSWTYASLYPAQIYLRDLVNDGKWSTCLLGTRIAKQLCRELLLLESSDWQFLISTGAAPEYAESRFTTHHDHFNELRAMYSDFEKAGGLSDEQYNRLAAIEDRDKIFAEIDPALWTSRA